MKAVVLLSGGLDSAVTLALAIKNERECYGLTFDYGQRHKIEIEAARKVAEYYKIPHSVIRVDASSFGESTLVSNKSVPKGRTAAMMAEGIPSTYVPARNTIFLAYALGQAEALGAVEIYAGGNASDYHCYPDCRPEFYAAFQQVANTATKQAVEGNPPQIVSPLVQLAKNEIAQKAIELGVPIDLTISCYDPTPEGAHCRECDACVLRFQALAKADEQLRVSPADGAPLRSMR